MTLPKYSIPLHTFPRLAAVLGYDIIKHQHVALLPLMQHTDLVCNVGQLLEIFLRNRGPIPEQLLGHAFSETGFVDLRILVQGRQSSEERRQTGPLLSSDSR